MRPPIAFFLGAALVGFLWFIWGASWFWWAIIIASAILITAVVTLWVVAYFIERDVMRAFGWW